MTLDLQFHSDTFCTPAHRSICFFRRQRRNLTPSEDLFRSFGNQDSTNPLSSLFWMYGNCCDLQCSIIFQKHEHKEVEQFSMPQITDCLYILWKRIRCHVINTQFQIIWSYFVIISLQIHQNNIFVFLIMEILRFQQILHILGRHIYSHSSKMIWVNILALTINSSMTANSSAPCIRLSVPGSAQPKATPPSMSWT